jgi:hypothetical protein
MNFNRHVRLSAVVVGLLETRSCECTYGRSRDSERRISPSKQVKSEMYMPSDFLAWRLASTEEEKARRLAAIEEEKTAQAHLDRVNQQIPRILDCIDKMRLAGLSEVEIAGLFRHAADEIEKLQGSDI